MKRIFLLTLLGFLSLQSYSQITSAMVGVNGLTCSACTRAVEMSIRKLSFVKEVEMNLENTEGKVIFVDNADVDISKVAQAVSDAGFSVRYITASINFNNVTAKSGLCYNTGKYNLQFVNTSEKILNGESTVKFIGKEFLPAREFNKIKSQLVASCNDKNEKIYFVTL